MKICTVDSCEKPLLAREMCSKHYSRFMKYGDASHSMRQARTGRACSEDGCSAAVLAKGVCQLHYDRARRASKRNNPGKQYDVICCICGKKALKTLPRNGKRARTCGTGCQQELAARTGGWGGKSRISVAVRERNVAEFLALVKANTRTNESGCWEWQGFLEKAGYGNTRCNSRTWYVHRLVASMTNDAYQSHLAVHHACANRPCCNPDHLRVVTPTENAAEMFERNSYIKRIAALEAALAELDPTHPLMVAAP